MPNIQLNINSQMVYWFPTLHLESGFRFSLVSRWCVALKNWLGGFRSLPGCNLLLCPYICHRTCPHQNIPFKNRFEEGRYFCECTSSNYWSIRSDRYWRTEHALLFLQNSTPTNIWKHKMTTNIVRATEISPREERGKERLLFQTNVEKIPNMF